MVFPVEDTDRLLSTTRSVRRRLNLKRPVPEEILLDCIDLAEQAPTGGNQASRRWIVIRDPETKGRIADLYREVGGAFLKDAATRLAGTGHHNEHTMVSSAYLAKHLHEVPALVLVAIYGEHDESGRPGLFDSVIQAAWSFCLALRSRGLGSAWTTLHLGAADRVGELLGIPTGVTQVVLLPVAYTVGDEFSPAPRRPAREITWFERWGRTTVHPAEGPPIHSDGPGVTVEVDVKAPAGDIWPHLVDINLPARFSDEFQGAEWIDNGPALGARFQGRNQRDDVGEWQVVCHVVAYEEGRVFAWNAGDVENPAAQWRFELEPLAGTTRLRFAMILGPGPSGLTTAIESMPDMEARIIARRQDEQTANMFRTVEGIRDLVEGR